MYNLFACCHGGALNLGMGREVKERRVNHVATGEESNQVGPASPGDPHLLAESETPRRVKEAHLRV